MPCRFRAFSIVGLLWPNGVRKVKPTSVVRILFQSVEAAHAVGIGLTKTYVSIRVGLRFARFDRRRHALPPLE
ncbi:MAG: hypothetical protein OXG35_12880 [Acidobacteria bacterium]|nr:hypothetical protein [Acidobacteriota bacterium]